jgi:hypothetical protein
VTQEAQAEPDALARPLDQTGQVRDDERWAILSHGDDTEVRLQRREGVRGDLRPGAADRAHEGALADVGKAEQADVGHDFELEQQVVGLARATRLGLARRSIGRCGEVLVAFAPAPATGDTDALTREDELRLGGAAADDVHDGAERYLQCEVIACRPIAVFALAIFPPFGPVHGLAMKIEERGQAGVGLHEDATAAPAIPAGRPAMGDEALAPKRDGAVPAVAGFDPKATFVHEMHCGELIQHAAPRAATFTMFNPGSRQPAAVTGLPC